MFKLPAQSTKLAERTDLRMLDAWRRLSPDRQAHYSRAIIDEASRLELMLPSLTIRDNPGLLNEVRALARAVAIKAVDFSEIIDPSYTACTARSFMCTMAKLARVQDERTSVFVDVNVHEAIKIVHSLVPQESGFSIHIVQGPVVIMCPGDRQIYPTQGLVKIAGGTNPIVIKAEPGAFFKYAPHPLSAWVTEQK